MNDAIELIGRNISDEDVAYFLAALQDDIKYDDDLDDEFNYYSLPAGGLSLAANKEDGRITTVFLYDKDDEPGYSRYAGALPKGLSFTADRSQSRRILGEPDEKGDDWDKWDYGNWTLHLQYYRTATQYVRLITLAG